VVEVDLWPTVYFSASNDDLGGTDCRMMLSKAPRRTGS